jgi:hypothetical protein
MMRTPVKGAVVAATAVAVVAFGQTAISVPAERLARE